MWRQHQSQQAAPALVDYSLVHISAFFAIGHQPPPVVFCCSAGCIAADYGEIASPPLWLILALVGRDGQGGLALWNQIGFQNLLISERLATNYSERPEQTQLKCSATLVLEEEAARTGGTEESILVRCLSSCNAPCGLTTMRETQVCKHQGHCDRKTRGKYLCCQEGDKFLNFGPRTHIFISFHPPSLSQLWNKSSPDPSLWCQVKIFNIYFKVQFDIGNITLVR